MADDARAVGEKGKESLSPVRAATNAALAMTGMKPLADAAKTTADTARSDGEASRGEASGQVTGQVRAPVTAKGTAQVVPDGSAEHAEASNETGQSSVQHKTTSTVTSDDEPVAGSSTGLFKPPAGAPGGLHSADDPAAPTSPGGMAGSAAATGAKGALAGRRKAAPSGPEDPSGPAGAPASGGKRAAVQEGAAKGADLLGKSVGAQRAGNFVRKSDSDGTTKGDIKSIAAGAKDGAEIGAKFGGVGAPIGAAIGATVQGLKTKRGRWAIIASAMVPMIPVFALVGLVVALIATLLIVVAPATMSAMDAGPDEISMAAATTDGVDQASITIYQEAGADAGIPWEVLAAIVQVSTAQHDAGEAEPLSQDEVDEARESDDPVGPYALKIKTLDDMVDFTSLDGEGDYNLGLNGFEDRDDLFAHLNDLRSASDLVAPLLGSVLANLHGDLDSYTLGAGVILDEPTDAPGDLVRVYDTDDTDSDGQALDQNGNAIVSETGNAESEALREAYVDAIAQMPIDNAEANAAEIFDQAMMWYFGQPATCDFGASGVTSTGWTDPVVGPIVSPYGMRFHPIRLVMSLHDGDDISAAEGTPVHAASGGTVTVTNESWSGTNNLVTIDHGGGITTKYGHMRKVLVPNGATVNAGDVIGEVGSEGMSTGFHLHFMVEMGGQSTDPVPFMTERGVNLGVDPVGTIVGGSPTSTGPGSTGGGGGGTPAGPGSDRDGSSVPSTVNGGTSAPITGTVTVAQANIPTRSGAAGFASSMPNVLSREPDLVSLNEMGSRSLGQILDHAPGYSGFRSTAAFDPAQRAQANSTVVLWKSSVWTKLDGGRVQIADNDRVTYQGKVVTWDRYATWVLLQRADGAIVGFISAHHMTNPDKYGPDKPERQRMYGAGMDTLGDLIDVMSQHGPVFLAGDMNTQEEQENQTWSAAAKMRALGYSWVNDSVDYVFYPQGVTSAHSWVGPMVSDHHWVAAEFDMNDVGAVDVDSGTGPVTLPSSWTGKSSQGEEVTLDRTQLGFAADISAKGVEMGVPDDGIVIAFMTVLVESRFRNYASSVYPDTIGNEYPAGSIGSDHDSVGLFQQRPLSGWGPKVVTSPGTDRDRNADAMTLLDVGYAASAFFGGPNGPNGGSPMGLLDHPGWQSMAKGDAAQDVQVSAAPDRYATWEAAATELLSIVKGASTGAATCDGVATGAAGGYTVASFNVLGNSHTVPGGNKYPKWPQNPGRMQNALELLESQNVSVAGLQEFEPAQWRVVRDDPAWGVFPETPDQDPREGVIWRADEWTLVEGKQFDIPYFSGRMASQSYVRLHNNATDEEIYFISVHNPADVNGPAAQWRAQSLAIEETLVKSLQATGLPVFLVGDFNDRAEPFCALADTMKSAYGTGSVSPCQAPKGIGIDHIFVAGAPTFSSFHSDPYPKTNGISDHPLLTATVGASNVGAQGAIDWALKQVGKGYSQDADKRLGPDYYDCSGLVYKAFQQVGLELGTYTGTQQFNGKKIDAQDLQPGDLIFYYAPIGHVAIYLGEYNGVESIVHAANPRAGVEISPRSEMRGDEVMYRRVL